MSYQALLFCQDEKTARTIAQVLSELDFQVDPCPETFAAVKKLTSQPFEAIVVDCQNEENASLLLKTARNSASNQAALMVAVVEGQAGVAAAFRIGANLVLTKPIAVEQARGTLRVARGLLRKTTATAASVAPPSGAGPVAPVAAPVSAPVMDPVMAPVKTPVAAPVIAPVVAPPKAPVYAPTFAAASAPSAKPGAPAFPPARIPAASAPVAPRSIPPAIPAAPRITPAPVPSSALRTSSASSNLVSESEFQPQPDDASAGLLEALDFKEFEAAPASSLPPVTPEMVSVTELTTGAHEAVRAALAPKRPLSSQEFGAGFGAAAAAAPARELPKPTPAAPMASAAISQEVADLFEAPVFGRGATPSAPVESLPRESSLALAAEESDLNFTGNPAPSRSKTPLVAVAAVFVVAAALYFGWAQMHKPAAPATPTAGPLQPPPPDFGAADASTPAPAHAAESAAPAADTTAQPAPEPINRFARQNRVAEDRVTTPIAVVTPHTAPASTHAAPIQVKTDLQRSPQGTGIASQDAEAPSIASIGASAKTDALSSITRATPAALPAAPQQRISQGVSDGLLLKRVQPVYPQQAAQMRIQGLVSMQATIAKDGSIRNVKVISGPPTLARAATEAVRQWKYRPYLLNGEPVEVQTDIKINFLPPK